MAQYKKEQVQQVLVESAERLFAKKGYKNTTMADIAKEANISVGNIYRYYRSKDILLAEVLPTELVQMYQKEIYTKILTGAANGILEQCKNQTYIKTSEEFHKLMIENKLRLLILLQFPEGTSYEAFRDEIVHHVVEFVLEHFAKTKEERDSIREIIYILYEGYVKMLLHILSKDWEDAKMMRELWQLNQYHMMGLMAILEKE